MPTFQPKWRCSTVADANVTELCPDGNSKGVSSDGRVLTDTFTARSDGLSYELRPQQVCADDRHPRRARQASKRIDRRCAAHLKGRATDRLAWFKDMVAAVPKA